MRTSHVAIFKEAKMPLFLSEKDVQHLVDMSDAVGALDAVFGQWGREGTENLPRQRLNLPVRSLNLMAASAPALGVCGHKAYFGGCHYVSLFSLETPRLLAVIEAGALGAIRTGAASGVATNYLARTDAETVGIIGTGRQARTQLLAISSVRKLSNVQVFGRDANRRNAFAAEMADALPCVVEAAETAEACVRNADIVIAATKASEPVVFGDWLAPGCHVNAIGANGYARRELDDEAVLRASIVATDQRDQAQVEARELIDLANAGKLEWENVVELGDLVQGRIPGRVTDDDITLFKSLGIALEDIAFAKVIYDRAIEAGAGTPVAMN
jgi:ornithine cyclodeaminase/alanine dehydrogenase-like protein (mu-crystallin family)